METAPLDNLRALFFSAIRLHLQLAAINIKKGPYQKARQNKKGGILMIVRIPKVTLTK